jgi:hypothetical protein
LFLCRSVRGQLCGTCSWQAGIRAHHSAITIGVSVVADAEELLVHFLTLQLSPASIIQTTGFSSEMAAIFEILTLDDVRLRRANNCHRVGYVSKKMKKKSIPPAPMPGGMSVLPRALRGLLFSSSQLHEILSF